ncbi:hemolysin [Candidatus Peregrinibacteria bacterium CG10_big_fil_rev_8_21_14_0_10_36_19]|nr:MAG: hemolysin [Candidatus Peregrinibacteria bacterium CG10_big_fil_rev_8_21_14_0_10_36_19]
MYPQIIILIGLVVLSGVFSGSETALVSISNSKVDDLVAQKVRNSAILKKLKNDPHKLLITILIGNNIVNIGSSAYAAVFFANIFGSSAVGIATGVMTFLILVFGEITPKAFAHQHAVGVSLLMARPIYILQLLLFPIVWFFDKIVDLVNFMFGSKTRSTVTEGEIVAMLKIGAQEGAIEKNERELIENVLEFNDIEVEEVMTPRVTIEGLDQNTTIAEAVRFFITHSHSRLPVYNGDLDNIVGILSLKEILRFYEEKSPRTKLKNLDLATPIEVPFSKKINKLFRDFQRKHQHMAIVIDEYGGTAGLVTMEDLLEEIVGDISDEFDHHDNPMEIINKRTIIVGGQTLVEDVNDYFKTQVGDEERDTINTMILDFLHRFPREGEIIKMPRAVLTVLEMNKNTVERVKITKRSVSKRRR